MKKAILPALLVFAVITCNAQSRSYQMLREKFQGSRNVVSLSTSGFLARSILWMAGEHEYTDAIQDVRKIRMTVVPSEAFRANRVTLGGFKKLARKEGFQELAHVKERDEDITLLLQTPEHKKDNRYLLLVDSDTEIVVMEITGFVDPKILLKNHENIAFD